ncbi:MAG: M20/M25/M40 family metallo-hydrolase [Chloroflexi bacterium]|nr:M20/M25/M40 family metallo-hydrolase [Chloroflexota bacterium]
MDDLLNRLFASISAEHLRDLTYEMVRIPSPTGDAEDVTAYYVQQLRALGLEVQVLNDFPRSPSTVTRLLGKPGGLTLTLDGHLDTIHTSHAAPYIEGDRIVGRGAGDMKSGIAAMVETARVLLENDVRLNGNLILATHSLHEAPVGHMQGLKALLARGDVFVDAALVTEGQCDALPIRGKGQALYECEITREGKALHENEARPLGIPNPLDYAVKLAGRMLEYNAAWAQKPDPLLGPETFFLGQIHSGDFYNRVPAKAFMNGVHRYWPDKSWEDVERMFNQLIASVEKPAGLQIDTKLFGNGLGYEVNPDEQIVSALRSAYQTVVGEALQLVGALSVSDVNVIAREGGIPVVAHGTGSTTAHADVEWVNVSDIVRSTQVYLATVITYLGVQG